MQRETVVLHIQRGQNEGKAVDTISTLRRSIMATYMMATDEFLRALYFVALCAKKFVGMFGFGN